MGILSVKCPECNKKIEVMESWMNQDVRCRYCGHSFFLSQYSLPEEKHENTKAKYQFIIVCISIIGLLLFVMLRFTASLYRNILRHRTVMVKNDIRKKQIQRVKIIPKELPRQPENTISQDLSDDEKLENYVRTSTDSPEKIIRFAYFEYKRLIKKGNYSPDISSLDEILGKRFNMELEPAERRFSNINNEAQMRLLAYFPFSPEDYVKEMEETAKRKYPMARIGSIIEIATNTNETVIGVFKGYSPDNRAIYINKNKYFISDLTQSSAILVDNDLNRNLRKKFIEEKCNDYMEKRILQHKKIIKELMIAKGYIMENNQFYSPSEYLDSLKYGNANSVSSGRRYSSSDPDPDPSPRLRRSRRRFRRANIESNSAGSKNLSIPSRTPLFLKHVEYYRKPIKKKKVRTW